MARPSDPFAEATNPRLPPKERMLRLIAALEDAQRQGLTERWSLEQRGVRVDVPRTAPIKNAVRCGSVTVRDETGEGYAEDRNQSFSPRGMLHSDGMDPGAVGYNGYLLTLILIDHAARGQTWQWRQIEGFSWICGAALALTMLDGPRSLREMMMARHPKSYGLAFDVAYQIIERSRGKVPMQVGEADLRKLSPRWIDRRLGTHSTLAVQLDGLGTCAPP